MSPWHQKNQPVMPVNQLNELNSWYLIVNPINKAYYCTKVSNAPPAWMHWIFRITIDINDFSVLKSSLSFFSRRYALSRRDAYIGDPKGLACPDTLCTIYSKLSPELMWAPDTAKPGLSMHPVHAHQTSKHASNFVEEQEASAPVLTRPAPGTCFLCLSYQMLYH